ncbi:MAG: hypothetical protein B7Z52_00555 [Burkholderiales bacterium 12-64-5]|nr:MAG: hypothetical protein B7Z52_00555 [Burkholderiales bacterium 12-64-5]
MCAGRRTARQQAAKVGIGVPAIAGTPRQSDFTCTRTPYMNSIVYIVGAVVIVLAVLSFFGFR